MLLAAEDKSAQVTAMVYFNGESNPEDLWLRIGQHSGSHAVEIRRGAPPAKPEDNKKDEAGHKGRTAVFKVPHGVIHDGRNDLFIRAGRVSATILGIDVDVR